VHSSGILRFYGVVSGKSRTFEFHKISTSFYPMWADFFLRKEIEFVVAKWYY
jgi:hypothetical protein